MPYVHGGDPHQGVENERRGAVPIRWGGEEEDGYFHCGEARSCAAVAGPRKIGQNLGFPYFLGVILAQPHFKVTDFAFQLFQLEKHPSLRPRTCVKRSRAHRAPVRGDHSRATTPADRPTPIFLRAFASA